MIPIEAPALPSLGATDRHAGRSRGLELFCLSFLALFLGLMVIRWAPAVVRLIAYYANLILISSFLGLGVGAILGKKRKSFFGWLPAFLLINVIGAYLVSLGLQTRLAKGSTVVFLSRCRAPFLRWEPPIAPKVCAVILYIIVPDIWKGSEG